MKYQKTTLFLIAIGVGQSQAMHAAEQAAASPAEETVKLEAFTVTGSNIKRLEEENALPVSIITPEIIEARNAATPVEFLASIPSIPNVPLNESAQGSATARGDMSAINLHGVGSGNTLVLLNGRRMAPYPIVTTENGLPATSTNVNEFPTHGIAQIDVLRDGASSIYGTDAVAGVVNYTMKKNFVGSELNVQFGVPEHRAGEDMQVSLTAGRTFAAGRGRWISTFDFYARNAIYFRDRDFMSYGDHSNLVPPPFNVLTGVFNTLSNQGAYPSFRIGSSTTTNYLVPTASGSVALTTTAPARTGPTAAYYYNQNQDLTAMPRSRRNNWFSQAEFDVNDRVTVFGELSLYSAISNINRYPIPYSSGTDLPFVISADNPYNPYGSRFYSPTGVANPDGTPRLTGTPQTLTILTKRVMEMGREFDTVESRAYRFVGGARGKLLNTWTWEAAGMYSDADSKDHTKNSLRASRLFAAGLRTDATAYNPFPYTFKVQGGAVVPDQPYVNPPSVISPLTDKFLTHGVSSTAGLDFHASGPIVHLWSGEIATAFGGEFRRETYENTRPPYSGLNPPDSGLDPTRNDFVQSSSGVPDFHGDRTIGSLYSEIDLPLAAPKNDIPLVKSLEINGSARFERYSDFGQTIKPKFGLNWKPASWIMVRGSENQGFRAPNLAMLYQAPRNIVNGVPDPYRGPVTNLPSDGTANRFQASSGNVNLKPENSKGRSAGLVVEVPKFKDLSFSADYWEIKQSGVIVADTVSDVVNSDFALLAAATQAQLTAGTPASLIDLGSGTASYKGDPRAIRSSTITADDRALFAAYNAAHPTAQLAPVGTLITVKLAFSNRSLGFASGYDFGGNWRLPMLPIGRFAVSSDWSYAMKFYTTLPGSNILHNLLDQNGAAKWRGTTTLIWQLSHVSASVSALYVAAFADTAAATTAAVYNSLGQPAYIMKINDQNQVFYYNRIPSTVTYNTSLSYKFSSDPKKWFANSSIRLGVNNATNKTPPLAAGAYGYIMNVYTNLLPGRTWRLEVDHEF